MIAAYLLLALAAPSPDALATARLFFESGKRAFDQGEYSAAIAAFEQAEEIAPAPGLYFSMAQAHRLLFFANGRVKGLRTAGQLYAKYLAEAPKGRRRADAVEHFAAVETILARRADDSGDDDDLAKKTQLMISATSTNAQVTFRGETVAAPLILEVESGSHTATVTANGYETQIVHRVAVEGRLVVAHVELVERPAMVSVRGATDAELRIDGKRIGALPVTDLRLRSGEHRVQIFDRGKRPYDRRMRFDRGQDVALRINLDDTSQRTGAYWMLGIGGGTAIVGSLLLTLGLVAQSQAGYIETRLENGEALTAVDIERHIVFRGERDNYMLVAAPTLVGAALSLTIGSLIYYLDTPQLEQ